MLVAWSNLHATEYVTFHGSDYSVYVLMGMDEKPSVALVRFSAPGSSDWVTIPGSQIEVSKFDMDRRIVLLRFTNKNEPELPPSFSLSVKKKSGVLSINGKRITGSFDWADE